MKMLVRVILVGGAIAALLWFLNRPTPIDVSVVSADIGEVESTIANTRAGTVTACKRARLSLPIGGQIQKIHVAESEHVAEGQLLLELWNDDKRAMLEESTARVAALMLNADSVCIAAKHDQEEANRQISLNKQSLTSQEKLATAIARAESAKASCDAANANVEAMKASVGIVQAQIAQTRLIAPFAGTVAEVTGEVGEYTTPSPPGVATPPAIDLLTADCHYISAPIDEVDAGKLTIGQSVKITIDALGDMPIMGRVEKISPYVQDFEKQARTVTIEVSIAKHTSPHVLAGYSADVEVILDKKSQVLRLPTDLISNNAVLVVNADNQIESRAIKTGMANWHFTEVVSGIQASDRVVQSIGKNGVIPGALVRVVE